MFRRLSFAVAASMMLMGAAYADPIEGDWRTDAGPIAGIAGCGGSFCITMKTGKFPGKRIGTFKSTGGNKYSGKITDPNNDKTYSGYATLNGNSLKMQGCVLGVLCRTQNWQRQ